MGNSLTSMGNNLLQAPSLNVATIVFALSGWYLSFRTKQQLRAIEDREERRQKDAIRADKFNKGFPNTWYYLAKTSDIRPGDKKTFRLAGREILAFRAPNGELGVVHPFCPHLGTNLKHGCINNAGRITCPAHGWSFDTDGKCFNIPSSKMPSAEYPKGVHLKNYHHATFHEMIYVWIHDDWAEPSFALDSMFDYMKGMKPMRSLHQEWTGDMHVMEPMQNSADIHHFKYLHHEVPFFNGIFTADVEAEECDYCYKGDNFVFRMDNQAKSFRFFKETVSDKTKNTVLKHSNSVICYGPTLQLTLTDNPLCRVVHLTHWVPKEQFRLESYYMTFVDNRWYLPIAYFLERLLVAILAQDKPVWENRDNSMRLMDNDGHFQNFRKWLDQFYSEKNIVPCTDSLDW